MSTADNAAPATYTYDQLSIMWQVSVRHLQRDSADDCDSRSPPDHVGLRAGPLSMFAPSSAIADWNS